VPVLPFITSVISINKPATYSETMVITLTLRLSLAASLCTISALARGISHAEFIRQHASYQFNCNGTVSVASLGLSPESEVYAKSNPSFASETLRWTTHDSPSFDIAVRPALESDVQQLVHGISPRAKNKELLI
jgi:hypothetical protein